MVKCTAAYSAKRCARDRVRPPLGLYGLSSMGVNIMWHIHDNIMQVHKNETDLVKCSHFHQALLSDLLDNVRNAQSEYESVKCTMEYYMVFYKLITCSMHIFPFIQITAFP